MPIQQRPEDIAQDVDRISAAAMGQQPPAQQQPQQPRQQPSKERDTAQDTAASKGSPETEGDKQKADPVVYELDMGDGKKRKFTPDQLRGTLDRYSALNYRNAQLKPITDLVDNIMRQSPGMNPAQLADKMKEVLAAGEHNVQMGRNNDGKTHDDQPGKQAGNGEDMAAQLQKWAEDNAVSLPPGYEQLMGSNNGQQMQAMQQQMQQMQQMLQAVLGQAGGVADAARSGVQQGNQQRAQAIQQTIGNNIDRVQQALKIPDEKANDFMVFAAERGYTLEDFVDPSLTIKVMQDFRNQMDSPEMERMRQMAQRRQAFTGSMGAAPGTANGGGEQASEMGSTFDQFAASAMAKRGFA